MTETEHRSPEHPTGSNASAGSGPSADAARARLVGHCIVCNAMVERREDGSCPAGHSPVAVAGSIELAPGEPLPRFPKFNWGAFLIPPIWGVAHGLWAGVFFLPLWAFVDSAIRSTVGRAIWMQVVAWGTLVVTLAFQYEFGRTANRLAWRRASQRMTLDTYVRRQRLWAIGGAVVIIALAVWILIYLSR